MTFLRRLIAWRSCSPDSLTLDDVHTIPGCYLGHTFACQPNSDELRRAVSILSARNKGDLEKNAFPTMTACFKKDSIVFLDRQHRKCSVFEIRKVVVCCVDAKNQKVFAIFYHNDSPFIGCATSSRGLECHLFLARSKEVAKLAAMKVGQLLDAVYAARPRGTTADFEEGNLRISKHAGPSEDDIDYENISSFFKTKVFNACSLPQAATPTVLMSCDSRRVTAQAKERISYDDVSASYYEKPLSDFEEAGDDFTEGESNRSMSDISYCMTNESAGTSAEIYTSSGRSSSSEFLLVPEFPCRPKSSSTTTYDTLKKASSSCICLGKDDVNEEAAVMLLQRQFDQLNNNVSTSHEMRRLLSLSETDI